MAFPYAGKSSMPKKTMSGNAKVGSGAPMGAMSSGKMASGNPHVNLGTTHGNHSVGHAVKGKSGSTPNLGH